ncbi:DNA cytosine methyltransferase [Aeromonas salmonicida]|uniref:DNA cytosine methyltransferase n=1 Tax=Aeromonas salmonicida TaxID=645 RepID=UPI003D3131B6
MFSGLGGWSTGAVAAGCRVLWAGNHWKPTVYWHQANHPETQHACQDLRQADWSQVPSHDLMLASPCCQGHSKARGKANGNPQHDDSRATAWAVVDAMDYHRPYAAMVENVTEFREWALYPAWCAAIKALGYSIAPHVVNCADLGVPQERMRLVLVCTRSAHPLLLDLPEVEHAPASTFIDFNAGKWSPVTKPGRAVATLNRVANGRAAFGDRFVMPYYGSGSGLTGRSLARPIGTITTRDRWAVVDGDRMRMLTVDETALAMSFPLTTKRPAVKKLAVHMLGNAVPPLAGQRFIEALRAAA